MKYVIANMSIFVYKDPPKMPLKVVNMDATVLVEVVLYIPEFT